MKKYLLFAFSVINQILLSSIAFGQIGTFSLEGVVLDSLKLEPVPFCNVVVLEGDQQITGASTDLDGIFKIQALKPGKYEVKVSSVGHTPKELSIQGFANQKSRLGVLLQSGIRLEEVVIIDYKIPLVERDRGCYCCYHSICCYCGASKGEALAKDDPPKLQLSEHSLSIFPNPATSDVSIDLSLLREIPASLSVLDAKGRIVLQQSISDSGLLTLCLDGLSDGVYFASVQLKDELLTERFIVAR